MSVGAPDMPRRLSARARALGLDIEIATVGEAAEAPSLFAKTLPVLPVSVAGDVVAGRPDSAAAGAVQRSIERADHVLVGRLFDALHGDSDPDLSAELLRQCGGDDRAQPVLQIVLGELVRCSQQRGVLDQSEGAGQAYPGFVMRPGRTVIQVADRSAPDVGKVGVVVIMKHGAASTPG